MDVNYSQLKRIYIIGTSGCGKTTFGQKLGEALGIEARQIDEFFWKPGWVKISNEALVEKLTPFIGRDEWILDGNYQRMQPHIFPRATMVIWLDYSFARIMYRITKRTVSRSFTGEELYNGNRESIRNAFFSTDSIILWAVKTFGLHRRKYRLLAQERRDAGEVFIRFSHPRQAEDFLTMVSGGKE